MGNVAKMHIRTQYTPRLYVHEVHGVVFLSWVAEKDRRHAQDFDSATVDGWLDTLQSLAGCPLEAVPAHSAEGVPFQTIRGQIHPLSLKEEPPRTPAARGNRHTINDSRSLTEKDFPN